MRALIRGTEIYPENRWSEYTKNNLDWYIGAEKDEDGNPLKGDGWTLVEDYVENTEPDDEDVPIVAETPTLTSIEEDAPDTIGETVQIGDKTYSLEELRQLINQ